MSAEQNHIVPVHDFIVWLVPQNSGDFMSVRTHDPHCVCRIIIGQPPGNFPTILIHNADGVALIKRTFHRLDPSCQQAGPAFSQRLGAALVNRQAPLDPSAKSQPTFSLRDSLAHLP